MIRGYMYADKWLNLMTYRIFISSVQREFAKERKALADYICQDAILGRFLGVFLFYRETP